MSSTASPLSSGLRDVFASRKVFTPEGKLTDLHSNVSETEASELYEAVREIKPAVSLEVGFAQGTSAQAILQALEENGSGHHHVMDPFQAEFGDCGLEMVRRSGFGHRMTFHRKFAEEVIPTLPEIGFAFIDASHLFDLTLSEFVLADKKLSVGGVVAFHDMWMASQQAFVRYVLSNRKYRVFRPAKSPPLPAGPRPSAIKEMMRGLAAAMPGAERVFARNFLRPWAKFELGNMVFLQKTEHDRRDWKFHQPF